MLNVPMLGRSVPVRDGEADGARGASVAADTADTNISRLEIEPGLCLDAEPGLSDLGCFAMANQGTYFTTKVSVPARVGPQLYLRLMTRESLPSERCPWPLS
jgi:hypothetical protein